MIPIPRRKFLQLTGVSLAALMTNELFAMDFKKQINALGLQLFTIPQMVAKDLKGTLETLSTIGYREVEFFGPYPFSLAEIIEGWKPIASQLGITQNAFYGYPVTEVRKMLDDYKMKAPSAHIDIRDLRSNMEAAMKNFQLLGVKYLAIPSLRTEEKRTADDYKKIAEEFNQLGKQMSAYGIKFAYHNHGYEHAPLEGQIPMDILLKNTDPNSCKI